MYFGAAATRVKVAALVCFDSILKLTPRGTPRPDRVLIVRLDGIGDFVLWLDAAQALVRHYKERGQSAFLVANALWASWAKDLAIFEDVIAVDVKKFQQSPRYRYNVGRDIRSRGCAIAIEPTYSRHCLLGDSIIRISGSDVRIGSIGDSATSGTWQRRIGNRWYTRFIFADPSPFMELERNAEFMRGLGEVAYKAKLPQLDLANVLRIDDAFSAAIDRQPYYVLFPGAGWEARQWSASNFIEIADRLFRRTGWQGVVCGGSSDFQLADALCRNSTAPLINWAGRTDLAQLTSVLSTARLLLTNETSAVHIAAACGVPTVCLLGGGHYGRFLPYKVEQTLNRPLPHAIIHEMPCFGCNWQCIYKRSPGDPVPCIQRIPVVDAWHAISEALGFSD